MDVNQELWKWEHERASKAEAILEITDRNNTGTGHEMYDVKKCKEQ